MYLSLLAYSITPDSLDYFRQCQSQWPSTHQKSLKPEEVGRNYITWWLSKVQNVQITESVIFQVNNLEHWEALWMVFQPRSLGLSTSWSHLASQNVHQTIFNLQHADLYLLAVKGAMRGDFDQWDSFSYVEDPSDLNQNTIHSTLMPDISNKTDWKFTGSL